jgi:4-diphosphocytidyl-2-C-methyl-D-erythritol kinase
VTLALEAFAKVNRRLLVLGKRPDGYHEIDTLFQTIDLADRLILEPAPDLTLSLDDPRLTAGEDNLVLRAARALQKAAGVSKGASLRLEKRIPWGAGLGGGSADAAAALHGLAALWELPAAPEALQPVAASVGSDVAFFLHGGRARGTGRGENVEPLPDAPDEWLVLLFPPFGMATPDVYRALDAPEFARRSASGVFARDRNDLEAAAERLRPELRVLREALLSAGAVAARLSGSGSTVFGLFGNEAEARLAASLLEGRKDARAVVVRTVPRSEFRRRALPPRIV